MDDIHAMTMKGFVVMPGDARRARNSPNRRFGRTEEEAWRLFIGDEQCIHDFEARKSRLKARGFVARSAVLSMAIDLVDAGD